MGHLVSMLERRKQNVGAVSCYIYRTYDSVLKADIFSVFAFQFLLSMLSFHISLMLYKDGVGILLPAHKNWYFGIGIL